MPRKKSGAKWAKPNRSAAKETRLEPDFVPFAATHHPIGKQPAFSLQQEARNTSGHRDWWDQKLRNSKVSFRSAGTDHPSAIDPEAMAKISLEDESPEADDPDIDADEDDDLPADHSKDEMQLEDMHSSTRHNDVGFILDTKGTGPIDTGLPPPIIRSVSPTPSDSSEEVILFKGRNNMASSTTKKAPNKRSRSSSDAIERRIRIVEDKIHQREEMLESIQTEEAQYLSLKDQSRNKEKRRGRGRGSRGKGGKVAVKEQEDALLADYIANMEAEDSDEGDTAAVFKNRELGGSDVEIEVWVDTGNESSAREINHKKHTKPTSRRRSSYSWNRDDINDLDDLPTSEEIFSSVQEILSKRQRPTGIQYLVVWDEHMRDECRWVPKSTLVNISGAAALIRAFEIEEKLVAEFENNGASDDDSDDNLADSDEDSDEDTEEDEEEVNGETMSDEQIARLLAKQEELGMGSERLMLFDDAANDEEDESRYIIQGLSKPSRRGAKRPRGEFPAASVLADAYDGFDIMDRDRPSLTKKPKARKGKGLYDVKLSDMDQDLATQTQLQYEKDCDKKKWVKQEREELRAQGLLGKGKKGQSDMKAKYKEGITLSEIKEEIRAFLLSDSPQFALPPMEKAHRKLVHEIASAFNLKSSSYGSGKTRFPMLTRTNRTIDYNERLFQRLQDRLGRRFLPRMDVGKKYGGAPRQSGGGRGGGFSNAAVSYRDGEVVGGSAPELGIDNKGRAMLEKMGWNKGDALGALNNKGILQPVSHVVKTTKAGLG